MEKVCLAFCKVLFCSVCLCLFMTTQAIAGSAPLQNKQVIELWPGTAPGSENVDFMNTVVERSNVAFLPDRIVTKINNPSLTAFLPEKANGTSVIVAPGGAYSRIVLDKEAVEVANWLNPLGVTVFVLQYRLPYDAHQNAKNVPLEDGQRAVRLVRNNAAAWGLDANKIGLLGFSAAGHLAAEVNAQFDKKVYEPVDEADKVSARPDFTILGYPVITMDPEYASLETKTNLLGENPTDADLDEYSPNLHISKNASTAFIVLADDDPAVPPANGVLYYLGLKKAGVQAEMHIFKDGGHGFGLTRTGNLPLSQWPKLCEQWMKRIGVLN